METPSEPSQDAPSPEVAAEAAAPTPETVAPVPGQVSVAEETGADDALSPILNAAEEAAEDAAQEIPTDEATEDSAAESGTDEEVAEPDAEPADAPATAEPGDDDPMAVLCADPGKRRLPPADEDRLTQLLIEALKGGREGVTRAIKYLPRMPWLIAVNGVTAAWAEMKPAVRNRLLAGLAREDSEASRRVRLSLARGLYKQDQETGLKLAAKVAKDLRDKETGLLGQKDAQSFSNVFIGRGRAWVAQLSLASLKPAEAELLVQCAVATVFQLPHAPATQLGVLRWAAEAGVLTKLAPGVAAVVQKGVSRWNPRWRAALAKEVAELPAELQPSPRPETKPERPERKERGGRKRHSADEADEEEAADEEGSEPAEASEEDEEAGEDREVADEAEDDVDDDEDDDDEEEDEDEDGEAEERETVAQPYKQRPVYESKTMPNQGQGRRGGGHFNLSESLKQIEQHVRALQQEAQQAGNKLRQRDEELRKLRRESKPPAPVIPGEQSPDELARLTVQLESRNQELEARITELLEDAETRAASSGAVVDASPDPATQLRALLSMKLEEDYADFLALEVDSTDRVVQQHYRTVLRHVFEVLRAEGVPLGGAPVEQPEQ